MNTKGSLILVVSGSKLIQATQSLGLYMIVGNRLPFICAEWEFGGLPGGKTTRERPAGSLIQTQPLSKRWIVIMIKHRAACYQVDQGGPIMAMQVESCDAALMEKTKVSSLPFRIW